MNNSARSSIPATATIAELISNAWDADARTVWIDLPLGTAWTESDLNTVTVTDDGVGRSYKHAESRDLHVGHKRRAELDRDTSEGGRSLHGWNGIDKLAAIGAAKVLECHTVDQFGDVTSIRFDPAQDDEVEPATGNAKLYDPDGNALASGTRITLSSLRPRRAQQPEPQKEAKAHPECRTTERHEEILRVTV